MRARERVRAQRQQYNMVEAKKLPQTKPAPGKPGLASRGAVAAASRIVVKVGTNVIMRTTVRFRSACSMGSPSLWPISVAPDARFFWSSSLEPLAWVRNGSNWLQRPSEMVLIQACAAVGQSRLMSMYDDAFEKLGYRVAQVLLTEDDFLDPQRHQNLRATLATLLDLGVIPIVNENDTVSTAELDRPAGTGERARVFGDNDKLSALVLTHVGADLLILLSDVDGLYTGDPQSAGATLIPEIDAVTDAIRGFARGGNGRGRGGMETKLEAVRIANEAQRPAVIANGRTPGVLDMICAGQTIGTLFVPGKSQ